MSTSDFLIVPSTASMTLSQGTSGSDAITVFSLNGFNSSVALFATWLGGSPSGVDASVPSLLTPNSDGQVISQLTISANSTASPGSFVVRITGMSGSLGHTVSTDIEVHIDQTAYTTTTQPQATLTTADLTASTSSLTTLSLPSVPTSCAISSSTAGSVLSPLVQKLRNFRDSSIMKSNAGRAFMMLFNSWYYSFSPQVAAFISTHPTGRSILRDGLYPLVAVLYTSYYVYALFLPLGLEAATVLTGIVAASLLGLVYLAPIVFVVNRVLRRHTQLTSLHVERMILWVAVSVLQLGVSYLIIPQAVGIAAANVVLSTLTLAALTGSAALSSAASLLTATTLRWLLINGGGNNRFISGLTPPGLKAKH